MEDFFKRYKKKRLINHLSVFGLAFMLALWVHVTILSGDRWQNFTASLLDVTREQETQVQQADLYAEIHDNVLIIKNGQAIDNLDDISFTIAYNPELGSLSTDELWGPEVEVQAHENEPWLMFIQLMLLETQDLPANSRVVRLPYLPLEDGRQFFNIIQASFTDSDGEIYFLSSSWTWL